MPTFNDTLDGLSPARGQVALFWLEQSHFIFKTAEGTLIHIDPFLSRVVKPENHIHPEPVIAPDQVRADLVFLTHDHRDHTDVHTLGPLGRTNPECQFVGPQDACLKCREADIYDQRLKPVSVGMQGAFGAFSVQVVHAENTDAESPTSHLGYVFRFGDLVIYHTGDTRDEPDGYLDQLAAVAGLAPDVFIVPINTLHHNPGPQGAARLVEIVQPRMIIPCHFGCFTHNTIDPALFVSALPEERRGDVVILDRGQGLLLDQQGDRRS